MRKAKQSRADDLAARAQQMANERSTQFINDINAKTNNGLTRSMDANREMLKGAALESSVLGRQGKEIGHQVVEPQYPVQGSPLPRDNYTVEKSIVGKRKTQPDQVSLGADSIPPGYRRIMYRDIYSKKNDAEPRFHPQSDAKPAASPASFDRATYHVAAHGITQNPVEEARRRRKLEAKIREVANAGK